MILSNRTRVCKQLAFLFTLNRMASLKTLFEHQGHWGYHYSTLCRIFDAVMSIVYIRFRHIVLDSNLHFFARRFAFLYHRKFQARIVAPVPLGVANICGTIDATVFPVCKTDDQQLQLVIYNGKDRVHAIKFQNTSFPDGLGVMTGPMVGRRHDEMLLDLANTNDAMNDLQLAADIPPVEHKTLYMDKGYVSRSHWRAAFRNGVNLVEWMVVENTKMKVPRGVCAEMPFGKILSQNKYLAFSKGLKLQMSGVGVFYIVGCLFANALSCLYGNTVSEYFDCQPPRLYDYMQCRERGVLPEFPY